jgi:predicted CoA-binding protein
MKSETVFILGASDNPERYSYKAWKMLQEYGHKCVLVSPRVKVIDGEAVYESLSAAKNLASAKNSVDVVDTLTMYVGPQISTPLEQEIIELSPKRVIFNPGSENEVLQAKLQERGIVVIEGCTLVMLRTGQF